MAKSHDWKKAMMYKSTDHGNKFLQFGGKRKLLGLRSFETQKHLVCKVKVAFDLFKIWQ